jgi:hypothetical protein
MQWLHRLIQDPHRLVSRYFRDNPAFIWHVFLQLTGLRIYPPMEVDPALPGRAQIATDR